MRADEQAIRELHSTWIDAVNAGDLERLLGMMTDDPVILHPRRSALGRDGFSANFSAAQLQVWIHCISELEEVVVDGELAYTRSRDSLFVSPLVIGGVNRLAGDRLTIYCKQPDGRWLLARDANVLSLVLEP